MLIDARVVLEFMEIVLQSCGIVPGRGLMIYLLIELINIYLLQIDKG
jgi:hypothetical protein